MQAIVSAEYFLGQKIDLDKANSIYRKLRASKENIVLIGMPSSGKTTVGRRIAAKLGRDFIDTDELLTNSYGKTPASIISTEGEAVFRQLEADIIAKLKAKTNAVIATGGGAVLMEENQRALKANGRLYFLDRPLDTLIATANRPITSTREDLEAVYSHRHPIYSKCADEIIQVQGRLDKVVETIWEVHSQ